MVKVLIITYLLWLFLGWFGVHHFYLRRDRQAFVWFALLGGYFGIGWFSDIWRIPGYVREATNDKKYLEAYKKKVKAHPKPPFSFSNFLGQLAFANMLGTLYLAAIPKEPLCGISIKDWMFYLSPLAVALGVHTVGNFGHQAGGFKWTFAGASCLLPFHKFIPNIVSWSSCVSAVAFHTKEKKWRAKSRQHRLIVRIAILSFSAICYISLLLSYLYFNAEIQDKNGDTIKVRDAVSNFFKSPIWLEFKESVIQVYKFAQENGWSKLFQELIEKFDPHGEQNALKVLGLEEGATQEEIHAQYRKLTREWHPDRHKDEEARDDAQKKFIEIQAAYEILSDIKRRRRQKNEKAVEAS